MNPRQNAPAPALTGDARADACIREMQTRGALVAVAFSGGADSTLALLRSIELFSREKVVALHFHHGVRGDAADADLTHCLRMAERLGIRLFHEIRPSGEPADENSLRRDRRAFFDRACAATGAALLIQGHHADDVAETLLMRIGRGAGAGGLAAPRPVSSLPSGIPILRPLLGIRKTDIIAHLGSAGVEWRHDDSNDSPDFATRNRIRLLVARAWEAALPGNAVAGATRTRSLLQEDDEALCAMAERRLEAMEAPDTNSIDWESSATRPPAAVIRRMLHRMFSRHAPDTNPSAPAVDTMVAAIVAGDAHTLSLGHDASASFDGRILVFKTKPTRSTPRQQAILPVPGSVFWPDGAHLDIAPSAEKNDGPHSTRITGVSAAPLFCSSRSPGERYRPAGSPGSQKLQDAMINRKIPAGLRDSIPVVRSEEEIVWAPGLLPSEKYNAAAWETGALRLTWTPPPTA